MKNFVEKNKMALIFIGGAITILIIVCYYFYDKNTDFITEEDIFYNTELEENQIKVADKENEIITKNTILIHIAGAVKNEGVIEVEEGTRLVDVIGKSGGLKKDADLTNVNLAYSVQDGEKIYIPNKNDKEQIEIITIGNGEKKNGVTIVNINTATLEELEKLPGVGTTIANSIVEYRKQNGKFLNIEEIKNVTGIGEAKYDMIKNNICV